MPAEAHAANGPGVPGFLIDGATWTRARGRGKRSGDLGPLFASMTAGGAPPGGAAPLRGVAADTFKRGDSLAAGRYRLDRKLHDGRFATVWLGSDELRGGERVVLKLFESGDFPTFSAGLREAAAHAAAAAGRHPGIAALLATFEHRSPGGRHACLVVEPLGSSLEEAAARCGGGLGMGLPLEAVRGTARQALSALDHLHREARYVHMGVTPANLLLDRPFASLVPPPPRNPLEALQRAAADAWRQLTAPPAAAAAATPGGGGAAEGGGGGGRAAPYSEADVQGAAVKLVDFGRSLPLDRLDTPQGREPALIFASPSYRAPEEILALEYRAPAYDIWSLGCALFALATGSDLFDPAREPAPAGGGAGGATDAAALAAAELEEARGHAAAAAAARSGGGGARGRFWGEFDQNDAHLAQIVCALGRLPKEMVKASPLRRVYFLPSYRMRTEARYDLPPAPLAVRLVEEHGLEEDEAAAFAGFLSPLLAVNPALRPSAADMLRHPWLAGGGGGGEGAEGGGGAKGGRKWWPW
ncbi:MAG: kinase-like domain-containing protein [Monoraphidium minutum]|nr:MAG: kinase-like domain-containing protein [Monoraphidium minutum]